MPIEPASECWPPKLSIAIQSKLKYYDYMSDLSHIVGRVVTAAIVLLVTATIPASAYVGPGIGVGLIGSVLGIFFALALMLFGIIWYPLKKLFRKKTINQSGEADSAAFEPSE
jgi:ATP/ADP translocase